jgi:ABC-type nickel/cobalt efflux system permease component RcnA
MVGHHGPGASIADRRHRGRNVLLAFTMQGWGQMAYQGILVVSLLIFHGGGNPPYSELSAQWTFRVSFAFIRLLTLYLIYHRVYKLEFADHHLQDAKKKHNVTGYDTRSLGLVVKQYWHHKRLFNYWHMRIVIDTLFQLF